jgi:hypothetical protein
MTTAATSNQNVNVWQNQTDFLQTVIQKRDTLVSLIRSLPEHYEELSKSNFAKKMDEVLINKYSFVNLTSAYAGYCLSKGQFKRTLVSVAAAYGLAEDAEHLKMINLFLVGSFGVSLTYRGVNWACCSSKEQVDESKEPQPVDQKAQVNASKSPRKEVHTPVKEVQAPVKEETKSVEDSSESDEQPPVEQPEAKPVPRKTFCTVS